MSILYEILLYLLSFILLPFALWKGRGGVIKQRFFFDFPKIASQERPILWVHAVSFGEVKAIAPLIPQLVAHYSEPPYLVVSTVTRTGYEEAKRQIPQAEQHVYLPFDFGWNIRRCLKGVHPELVLLVEGDLWLNFLGECKRRGSKIVTVNAKVSERTARRFSRLQSFGKKLYGLVDFYCVQTECYKRRLLSLGVPEDQMAVTGNIKYDASFEYMDAKQERQFRNDLGISDHDFVVTVGSTHDPEEKAIMEALLPLLQKRSDFKVLLVPRHPERFDAVAQQLQEMKISFSRYSSLESLKKEKETGLKEKEQVVLVDAMGVLCRCYQISSVAVVAGSFTDKIGGHNLLEPGAYGVPVLFGPHTFTQEEMRNRVLEAGAGEEVELENMCERIAFYLDGSVGAKGKEAAKEKEAERERKERGRAGRALVDSLRGSTALTIATLFKCIKNP